MDNLVETECTLARFVRHMLFHYGAVGVTNDQGKQA